MGRRIICSSGVTQLHPVYCFSKFHPTVLLLFQGDIIIISLKCNVFSPWSSWNIPHLTLNNNHSLTQSSSKRKTSLCHWYVACSRHDITEIIIMPIMVLSNNHLHTHLEFKSNIKHNSKTTYKQTFWEFYFSIYLIYN